MKLTSKSHSAPICCVGKAATITIEKGVTLKIKDSHSAGEMKLIKKNFSFLGKYTTAYEYHWSKKSLSSPVSSSTGKPAKMVITSIKNTNPTYPHGVQINWKKLTKNTVGYQLQVSFSKSFANPAMNQYMGKGKKGWNVGLNAGDRIYARVRAYNVVNGKKKYGSWSAVKTQVAK